MNPNHRRDAVRVTCRARRLQRTVMTLAALFLVLTAVVWAERTSLKPGWNMFSPQQDIEVGQQVSADAERQLPMLNDDRMDEYVNDLGQRLADRAPGEEYPYRFKVVNDRAINAFALPGGPIYINRGVIEAADNESQLAGVIAHEISHIALRHGTNQASKASAAQLPLAILGGIIGSDSTASVLTQLGASFAVNSVLLKYSRTAESQADIMGTQILHDSGYDPRAMAQFFDKIEALHEGGGPVEFFSNHPSPENRIERVNQEVSALGGADRNARINTRAFDESTRYLRSLAGPPAQDSREASDDRRQSSASRLYIVAATYGAGDRFADVRQRLQSRVQDDRLDVEVSNSSMGGDPFRGRDKTLRLRYEWAGRDYDVVVAEDRRILIPTEQQMRAAIGSAGTRIDSPSEHLVGAESSLLRINHPDNWETRRQGDAMTIAPHGGLISDGQGHQAMAYGVIVNIFEPRRDSFGQPLQGPGYRPGSRQETEARLEHVTDQLVQELRLSNRNMRVIRDREGIRVDGDPALSTYLSNDSPVGGRETNWLVTLPHPEGLLFLVFTAPEREFLRYERTFGQMVRSIRIER